MTDIVASDIRRQAEAARDLVTALHGADEETLTDMVEGETSLNEAIQSALDEIDECEAMAAGLSTKIQAFAQRKKRFEDRVERLRSLIEQALAVASISTVKLPAATLTLKAIPPRPLIEDEAQIPSVYWRQPDPILDKTAINAAIKGGARIPGVSMTNGTVSLQIRRA